MKPMTSDPLPLLWSGHEISCYYGRGKFWGKGGTDLISWMQNEKQILALTNHGNILNLYSSLVHPILFPGSRLVLLTSVGEVRVEVFRRSAADNRVKKDG